MSRSIDAIVIGSGLGGLTATRPEEYIMTEPGPADVLREVESLHDEVEREGREICDRWRDWIERRTLQRVP